MASLPISPKRRRLSTSVGSEFRSAVPLPVPKAALLLGPPTFIVTYKESRHDMDVAGARISRSLTSEQLRQFLVRVASGDEPGTFMYPITIFVSGLHNGSMTEPLPDRPVLYLRTFFAQPYSSYNKKFNLEIELGQGEEAVPVSIPVDVDVIIDAAQALWRSYDLHVKVRQRRAQSVYESIGPADVRGLIASFLPYSKR